MNSQMASQHQATYQGQLPQQTQNAGQQRQVPNGQQKASQSQPQQQQHQQPQTQNPYANYNPQLALWSLEKPKNVEGWGDVEPEKQHVALQDIQSELNKFRRNKNSVKRALDEIPSTNCRRLLNELVEDQTVELWKYNKTIRFSIAGVLIDWRWIDRRRQQRQLKRVQVILQTEPSGYQEPQSIKPVAVGSNNGQGPQDVNKPMKANGVGQGQQQGPNMAQQLKIPPQPVQHMAQNQQFEQRPPPPPGSQGPIHGGSNAPPPPPPPPGGGGHQGHGGAPPPPPPSGGAHQPPPPPPPPIVAHHPHSSVMPGSYPGPVLMPGSRQGQPPNQILNPPNLQMMHNKKPKHRRRRDEFSSQSSSGDLESETGSSGSEPIQARNVEHGDYVAIGRRERGRSKHSTSSRKSRHYSSRDRTKSRSRSRSQHRQSRRRRGSDFIEPPPMGRHTMSSSKPSSPKTRPISNNNSSDEERGHRHGKTRHRRDSIMHPPTTSPIRTYNKKKVQDFGIAQPMSRGSSWESWGRDSDTASFGSTDRAFNTHIRPRGHDRTYSYTRQHHRGSPPTSRYHDDLDYRQEGRYSLADDYPHLNEPTFNGRLPLLQGHHHRNNLVQPVDNPFETASHRPAPIRSTTYAGDSLERDYAYPSQRRYLTGNSSSPNQSNSLDMNGLAEALLADYFGMGC
ncbi:hypothetical protein GQ44DRAFT_358442 [Phaeosphaeriaceae sp. PMI808]|nr:hypothetical protein GQ44DRAFT_358442 [Phaeosphaeriaceae sp. PMI808]